MNKKGFSKIDILFLVFFVIFIFIVYNKFFKEKKTDINLIETKIKDEKIIKDENTEKIHDKVDDLSLGDYKTIREKNLGDRSIEDTRKEDENIVTSEPNKNNVISTDNGYYKNAKYKYEITCPTSWPLRVRSEENISIGTVPPKNGVGAINIKVGSKIKDELEQAKKMVAQSGGMASIKEEKVVLAGITGTKVIVSVMMSPRDIYILLNKDNFDYLIKYSEESPGFISQAEEALKTFKFL